MRLRSSQLVFLLLLACSVQVGEVCALRLVAGQTFQTNAPQAGLTTVPGHLPDANPSAHRPVFVLGLSQSAVASHQTPWSMPYPASASAAVASFTGLLRA